MRSGQSGYKSPSKPLYAYSALYKWSKWAWWWTYLGRSGGMATQLDLHPPTLVQSVTRQKQLIVQITRNPSEIKQDKTWPFFLYFCWQIKSVGVYIKKKCGFPSSILGNFPFLISSLITELSFFKGHTVSVKDYLKSTVFPKEYVFIYK